LGLFLAITIGSAVAYIIKVWVGRLRPDFLSRCQWNGIQCDGIPKVIAEGGKSFPSGHSTIAFAAMSYLAFYIAGRCRFFCRESTRQMKMVGVISILVLFIIAACIGYSRVYDHWHHITDVIAGSILGILSAFGCYHRHFYWVGSHDAGISKWFAERNREHKLSVALDP
jgi:diacylglycerol diphosphate phosphatase/phosphatidate phosphatase